MSGNVRPESMARITTPELAKAFIDEQIAEVRAQVGDKKVLLALSGGVDSSKEQQIILLHSKGIICYRTYFYNLYLRIHLQHLPICWLLHRLLTQQRCIYITY